MEDLTFGEQVKIVLGRKGMTIKELVETIEKETGKKMSRQNLTQRLGRDNFQEQDMRLIASILGCPFQLSIMSGEITESAAGRIRKQEVKWNEQEQPEERFSEETEKEEQQLTGEERDMTIGEIYDMHEELAELEKNAIEAEPTEGVREDLQTEEEYKEEPQEVPESDQEEENSAESEVSYTEDYAQPTEEEAEPYEEAEVTSYETQPVEPVQEEATYEEPVQEEIVQEEVGDINPYTGREYESNSVRMHPKRIGYVQVYDRANHKWTDMTEWAFLGYQERKKVLLGEDYEPPIYLD